jgi:hypothetical protein
MIIEGHIILLTVIVILLLTVKQLMHGFVKNTFRVKNEPLSCVNCG